MIRTILIAVLAFTSLAASELPLPGESVAFRWDDLVAPNRVALPGGERRFRVRPRGLCRYGGQYAMETFGGGFVDEDGDQRVAGECRASGQVAIAGLITPAQRTQRGRIVSLAAPGPATDATTDVALIQDGAALALLLRAGGTLRRWPLLQLADTSTHHVAVSYASAGTPRLACWIDGVPADVAEQPTGDLDAWTPASLAFGDAAAGGAPWRGRIESVVVASRALDAAAALTLWNAAQTRLAARPAPARLEVDARLVFKTPPDRDSVYPRWLTLYVYEVVKVHAGAYPHRRLQVAHYGFVHGTLLTGVLERSIGTTCRLTVEPIEAHPVVDKRIDTTFNASDDFELPIWFDVASPDGFAAREDGG